MMRLNYRTTESFYDGFQKIGLFTQKELRISAAIFVIFAICVAPIKIFVPSGVKSESLSMILWLAVAFPLSTKFFGGVSRAAWRLYTGFAVLYLIGLVPAAWGMRWSLFLMLPAACFLVLFLRAEPRVLRSFGYSGKPVDALEVAAALISLFLCLFIIYSATIMLQKTSFVFRSPMTYIMQFFTIVPKYAVVWGVLYGVLTKRLLELKFEPLVPIFINVVLVSILWFTEPYDVGDTALIVAKTFSWAVVLNLILGMSYYFTRTVRPILFAHALTCIIFASSNA